MSGHYVSFAATASLRQDAEAFIANIQSGERASQSMLLQQVLDAFVNECLQVFFLTPADVVGLSPIGRKLLTTAIATIRKTLQMVLGRITRKLSNRDMRPLALFMDEVMVRDRRNPNGPAFITFELEDNLGEELQQMQQSFRDGCPGATEKMIIAFQTMANDAIVEIFAEPVAMLNLGPVLRKLAEMGIDTTRSVTLGLIRRLFGTLSNEQLAAVLDYFCGMITADPAILHETREQQLELA